MKKLTPHEKKKDHLELLLLITICSLLIYHHSEYLSLNSPFLPLHHIHAYSKRTFAEFCSHTSYSSQAALPVRKRSVHRQGITGGQHCLSYALLC